MPTNFKIPNLPAGIAVTAAQPGGTVGVRVREIVKSADGEKFTFLVEGAQSMVFDHIPNLPKPWTVQHLLAIIRRDRDGVAYVDELQSRGQAKTARPIKAGEPVYGKDILDLVSLDFGVEIPPDCGVLFYTSFGWRRSLFYDYGPLVGTEHVRDYDLKPVFAHQLLDLVRWTPFYTPVPSDLSTAETGAAKGESVPPSDVLSEALIPSDRRKATADRMRDALGELRKLLESRCEDETRYQEFLIRNPWILIEHKAVERHPNLDDQNIPDFTAIRNRDEKRDVIEIKQPFLKLFVANDDFSNEFHKTWTQAERYLKLTRDEKDYLKRQKGLEFENPSCVAIIGFKLTDKQMRAVRDKESHNANIKVLTYEDLLRLGERMLNLVTGDLGDQQK